MCLQSLEGSATLRADGEKSKFAKMDMEDCTVYHKSHNNQGWYNV